MKYSMLLPLMFGIWANHAHAQKMIVFGDCQTDTNSKTRHMPAGTAWIELLPKKFEGVFELSQDTNFAKSGDTLAAMYEKAKTAPSINPSDVVIGLLGAGDCFHIFTAVYKDIQILKKEPGADPNAEPTVTNVDLIMDAKDDGKATEMIDWHVAPRMENLKAMALVLSSKGARRFIIPNIPDLSRAPHCAKYGPKLARKVITQFNENLLKLAQEFRKPGNHTDDTKEMTIVDAFSASNKVCDAIAKEDMATYFHPDGWHPTYKIHELIVNTIAQDTKAYLNEK